jgi:hypothetical protein
VSRTVELRIIEDVECRALLNTRGTRNLSLPTNVNTVAEVFLRITDGK